MRRLLFVVAAAACSSERAPSPAPAAASAPAAPAPATASAPAPAPAPADAAAPRPPDEMDERMRHCPLALDGAATTLSDIPGGVRFDVTAPAAALADLRRRAAHIVDFAARRTRAGHGDFDGQGGGRMKNCPVVTDDVTITSADTAAGVRLDVRANAAAAVPALRAEARARAARFPFAEATIDVVDARPLR